MSHHTAPGTEPIDTAILAVLPPAFGYLPPHIRRPGPHEAPAATQTLSARPPLGLGDRHNPHVFNDLWQRLLAVVRDPVRSVEHQGLRHLLICGCILIRIQPDGKLDAYRWTAPTPGQPVLQPGFGESVLGTPWRLHWLDDLGRLAAGELAYQAAAVELLIDSAVDPAADTVALAQAQSYTQWAFRLFARQLRHHADLRQLRHRVARALNLDPWVLRQAARIPRTHFPASYVAIYTYNRVVRHLSAFRTLSVEADHLVPLFGALCDEPGFPVDGEPVSRLKRHLQARIGLLKPRHWRWIAHASPRLLKPVSEFYRGDVAEATLDLLTLLCQLTATTAAAPPPWLLHELLSTQGNRDHRWRQYASDFDRGAAYWPRIVQLLSPIEVPTPALIAEVQQVQDWIFNAETLPTLTQNQKRGGWPYLVKLAQDWTEEQAVRARSVDESWWVPFETETVDKWTLVTLSTPWAIWDEGRQLRHCVAMFEFDCRDRDAVVISVREGDRRVGTALLNWRRDGIAPRRRKVIERGHWVVESISGFANTAVPQRLERALSRWLEEAPWRETPSTGAKPKPEELAQDAADADLIDAVVDAVHRAAQDGSEVEEPLRSAITAWLSRHEKAWELNHDLGRGIVVARDRVRDWTVRADRAWESIHNAGVVGLVSQDTVQRTEHETDPAAVLTEAERSAVDRYFVDTLLKREGLHGDGYGFWGAELLAARDGRRARAVYRLTGHSYVRVDVGLLGFCVDDAQVGAIVDRHGWTARTFESWPKETAVRIPDTPAPAPAPVLPTTLNVATAPGIRYFEVNASGTLTDPSVEEPERREQVYDVNLNVKTIEGLISQIEYCEPLADHFRNLALEECSELASRLDDEDEELSRHERRRLQAIVDALDENGEGWDRWLILAGKNDLPRFIALVKDWLEDDINWNEQEHFEEYGSGQSSAKAYFEDFDAETLEVLGVEIIEGDHPGSTYYAAELRKDVADANREALIRGLTCRFREGEGA